MPIDPRAKRFLDRVSAMRSGTVLDLSVDERRAGLRALLGFSGPVAPVSCVSERVLEGPNGSPLALRIYTPVSDADAVLVYFHGGGLVAGSLDTHDPICRSLSHASSCVVVSVDYRLAPEHPFPAAIADGCCAVDWVSRHMGSNRVVVCGDSAGATLAAVVCQVLAATTAVRVALQFLLCPIMDFTAQSASRREFASGYLVDQATLDHDLKHYLRSGEDPSDPRISPLRVGDVRGVPPTLIHTAEFDPLRDEGAAYAERLSEAGVRTTYRCHSGMIHLFYGMGALIPYAATAYQLIGHDIRSMLMPGDTS
jgi:acetyl esterase